MITFVGIDGCPYGWVATVLDRDSGACHVQLYMHISELWDAHQDAKLLLIDMPIGLPDTKHERRCESEARARLKPNRASSIFPVPMREVLSASDYTEANVLQRKLIGKGLSRQTWGIVPKIRELDVLLRSDPVAKQRFRESHPELCFAAWVGTPMRHNKKTENGYKERLEVLRELYPPSEQLLLEAMASTKRSQVARDDLVDSMVLAYTAFHAGEGLAYVPDDRPPAEDGAGLAMRIALPPRKLTLKI